jgi:hypothetical protein
MRSPHHPTSRRVSTPSNAFAPAFLEQLRAEVEPLTAAEADLAGHWKLEPVAGHPGAVAVLWAWESQAQGDIPEAVYCHEETGTLGAVAFALTNREPLFHLESEPEQEGGPLPDGYPVTAVYGEQGPQVCAWLRRYNTQVVTVLHVLEALVRSPQSLAEVNRAAGGGALEQVGRYLAARQPG